MKVVINKCYGGFGLSQEALQWLIEKKGWTIDRLKTSEEWDKSTAQIVDTSAFRKDERLLVLNIDDKARREHPDIIAAIEALGKKANGEYALLEIVEIPDGIEFEIEEYDGREWVAETHRTWG